MSASRHVLIDFSEAGLELDRNELEEFVLNVADEMQLGCLVEEVHLARESEIPEEAKPGIAGFLAGVLTAEISREQLGKAMNYLGNLRYGKTLTLSGEMDGMTYSIEYRNGQELAQATDTIERLSNLRIRVLEKKSILNNKETDTNESYG